MMTVPKPPAKSRGTTGPTVRGHLHCRRCGYDLCGLAARRCPECGQAFDLLERFLSRRFFGPPNLRVIVRWLRRALLPVRKPRRR